MSGKKHVVIQHARTIIIELDGENDTLVLQALQGYDGKQPAELEVHGGFINLGFTEDYQSFNTTLVSPMERAEQGGGGE